MNNMKSNKKELSPKQRDELLAALKARFDANKARHPGLAWAKVQARLEANAEKLWSLAEMERTGGEPDVVAAMVIQLLTEEEYFALQKLGEFDTKSSSWLKTPAEIRDLGGAIYGD